MPAANTAPRTKPTVEPLSDGAFRVTFPNGRHAVIFPDSDDAGYWRWSVEQAAQGQRGMGRTWGDAHALKAAWVAVQDAPAPSGFATDEVAQMAEAAERSTREATKVIKKILRARTGFAWSVRAGRGTASSWIDIRATKARATDECGRLIAADGALLSAILGTPVFDHHSIRPCGNVRAWTVYKLAGIEAPSTLKVSPPNWD